MSSDIPAFQHHQLIETIRDSGGTCSTGTLATELDISREEVLELAKELRRVGYLTHTTDYDWKLDTTVRDRIENHPQPDDLELVPDDSEIIEMAVATIAYPYASGSELSARRFARWLIGHSDSYSVSGVDKSTLSCEACGWTYTNWVHYTMQPKFCPECGEAGVVTRVDSEEE